jgi:hypothetical protein
MIQANLDKQIKELNVRIVDLETKSLSYASSSRSSNVIKRLESRIEELTGQLNQNSKDTSRWSRTADKSAREALGQLAESDRQRARVEEELKSYEARVESMRQTMDEMVCFDPCFGFGVAQHTLFQANEREQPSISETPCRTGGCGLQAENSQACDMKFILTRVQLLTCRLPQSSTGAGTFTESTRTTIIGDKFTSQTVRVMSTTFSKLHFYYSTTIWIDATNDSSFNNEHLLTLTSSMFTIQPHLCFYHISPHCACIYMCIASYNRLFVVHLMSLSNALRPSASTDEHYSGTTRLNL